MTSGHDEHASAGQPRSKRSTRRSWLLTWSVCLPVATSTACVPYTPSTARYPADWNPRGIQWRPYALGLRDAEKLGKPIVLVFYTDWCPHCHNYSRVFHDPRVEAASRDFIMIRVERDGHRDISQAYDLDGDYIPRTLFLTASAEVRSQLRADRSEQRYFLNEYEPDELLDLMARALELSRGS